MRVLVQQKDSGLYFEDIGAWIGDPRAAMDFGTSMRAIEFCVANRISGVQVVLKFDQEQFDIVFQVAAEPGLKAGQRRRTKR